jgi:hypothetical protein
VFEIAPGLSTGLCGVLNINGNANFTGGNIRFDFINGFTAAAGNHWDFFHANTITGWNTLHVTVNGLGAGLGWKITNLRNGKKRLSII